MTKSEKTESQNAASESVAKVNAWAQDAGDKLRDVATKATGDFKTAGNIAIEGEVQHNTRLLQLAGDLLNARASATLSILQEGELRKAAELEQNFLKSAMETLNAGVRELNEIRMATLRGASETFSTRAHEVIDQMAKPKADAKSAA